MKLNNLRNDEAFKNAEILIKKITENKNVIYSPNNGNWGDALIHKGIEQFLRNSGIHYKRTPKKKVISISEEVRKIGGKLENTVLISGGGGAWCKNYRSNYEFVNKTHDVFSDVIVMPVTYELPKIENSDNITYLRRDIFQSKDNITNSIFCHDMAFFLDLELPIIEKEIDCGYFFREDNERNIKAKKFDGNIDLSAQGSHITDVEPFFIEIAKCHKVKTDRMHVAIASCLLGIPVELYVGNYFKSKAVFQSSMLTNYSTCKLVTWD